MNLKEMFGDVRYVIMQGSPERARDLATFLGKEWNIEFNGIPIGKTERYSIYKVSHVLCISHGVGMASLSIILHETYKLLQYAGCLSKCTIIRSGTCGGIGVEPGTVAITTEGTDTKLNHYYTESCLGQDFLYSSIAEKSLVKQLEDIANRNEINTVSGYTVSAEGFYEDQGRTDGFFCDYDEEKKFSFLHSIYDAGVRNLEMEALLFLAFAKRANVRAGAMCTVIVNRLKGDQVTSTHEQLDEYMINNWKLISYLCKEYPEYNEPLIY